MEEKDLWDWEINTKSGIVKIRLVDELPEDKSFDIAVEAKGGKYWLLGFDTEET